MLLVAMDQSKLLTVSQVADALGASTQSIRNWIRAEQLDAVRIGNRFLISQAEARPASWGSGRIEAREPVGV
jgi:excisionase family DNA binding protein